MAIDIVKNLNTKPQEINQRTAQTATAGAQKMALEKAGAQGGASPTGRVNVAASLGEQQQEQMADNTVNQAAQANQQLAQQQGQMNAEQEFQERVLSDQELEVQNAYNLQMNSLFQQYEQNMQSLNQTQVEFSSQLLAQSMRLQNQKYMDELNDIARRENLQDDIAFATKSADIARGREMTLLLNRLDFNRMKAVDEIDFRESIGMEDIESALAIAMAQESDRRTAQNWQNFGTGVGAGATAYGTFKASGPNATAQDKKTGEMIGKIGTQFGQAIGQVGGQQDNSSLNSLNNNLNRI